MEDQEFINQLAEKLSKLGTVRPLGFHYLHPYGTVPADSIICNGATYFRALYKDFFDYITTQGWVKTEAEWQEIATRDNGFCPFYSSGDGSTNFRTPKFAPYQQIATGVAFSIEETSDRYGYGHGSGGSSPKLKFNASSSSSVYGLSSTVQPESHEWVMCVVVYGIATNVGSVDIQNVMSAVNAVQAKVEDKLNASTVHITETWKSTDGNSRYRKWSDGFIEQWGLFSGSFNGGTVTFPKQFSNTKYIFVVAPNEEGTSGTWFAWSTENKTTSSIDSIITGGGGDGISEQSWYAAGF